MFTKTNNSNCLSFWSLFIVYMNLSIICRNVRGIMSSAYALSEFLDENNVDVCVVTEHKLMTHSLHFMDTINKKYHPFSTADTSLDRYGPARCGKGGVSILFKKTISRKICLIETVQNERILGIKFVTRSTPPLFIIGSYMQADSHIDSYL